SGADRRRDHRVSHRSLRRLHPLSAGSEAEHLRPVVRAVRAAGRRLHRLASRADEACASRRAGVRVGYRPRAGPAAARGRRGRAAARGRRRRARVMAFAVACALLLAATLAVVLAPLRRSDVAPGATASTDANLMVYRQRLSELTADRWLGLIADDDQFARERE